MDLSNQGFHVAEGREEPKAFSNATLKGFGWKNERAIERTPFFREKRNALLISFRLCRLKFSHPALGFIPRLRERREESLKSEGSRHAEIRRRFWRKNGRRRDVGMLDPLLRSVRGLVNYQGM